MEIIINFAEQFFYRNTYENKIKTYYQLNKEEEDAFWMFLDNLLDNNDLEGKNKPSYFIDRYDPESKSIVTQEIKTTKGLYFNLHDVWHYHFEHSLSPYNQKQYYNKLTKPILLQNLSGRTNSYLIHYFKEKNENTITIKIIGISEHNCWEDLYKIIN